jgi:hypothetical protein
MRSSVAGPLYGAKHELISGSRAVVATGVTNYIVDLVTVPASEDWYITSIQARAETSGSAAGTMDLLLGGTTMLSAVLTFNTTGTSRVLTAASGEDEGAKAVSGSVITVVVSASATTAPGNMNYHVHGYIRNVR